MAAVAGLKMHDLAVANGGGMSALGAGGDVSDRAGVGGGAAAAQEGGGHPVMQIAGVEVSQHKDGWLDIETARGKWRRLRFNLDGAGNVSCWHARPDERVALPACFEVHASVYVNACMHPYM